MMSPEDVADLKRQLAAVGRSLEAQMDAAILAGDANTPAQPVDGAPKAAAEALPVWKPNRHERRAAAARARKARREREREKRMQEGRRK